MLQRIHIAGNLFADRYIVGPDEDHLTVDELEFVDARGVSCWDKIDDAAVDGDWQRNSAAEGRPA